MKYQHYVSEVHPLEQGDHSAPRSHSLKTRLSTKYLPWSQQSVEEKLKLLLYTWTIGNLFGIIYTLFRITHRITIKGYDGKKLDQNGRGLLVICNHPSPTEPIILPFLFYPRFLLRLRMDLVPYSLPASEYYYKWWFFPLRLVSVPIDRTNLRQSLKISKKLELMLKEGKVVLLHPEQERIYTEGDCDSRVSKSGKRMKKFRHGTRRLFLNTNCIVLPVWMDGGEKVIPNKSDSPRPHLVHWPRFWRNITIKIGEPMDVSNMQKNEVLDHLECTLLELADMDGDVNTCLDMVEQKDETR